MIGFLILPVSLMVLVVLGPVVAEAWRTRPLSEGEGSAGAVTPHSARPSGETRRSLAPSESDCGYETVLPDLLVTRHGTVVSLHDHQDALL